MIRAALLCLALAAAGCASTRYVEEVDRIVIEGSVGGQMKATRDRYEAFEATGKPVIIDGTIVSADAFLAPALPDVCYTPRIVWMPHALSYLGLIPAWGKTRELARDLPDPLERWFLGNMAAWDWIGFARVDYDQLLAIWPEGACPK